MTPSILIELAPGLTQRTRAALQTYLGNPFRLSDADWQLIRSAIDLLARSTVIFSERRYSFKQFYATFVNGTYARPYLQQLAATATPERDGPTFQAEIARKILAWLHLSGLTPLAVADAEYLIIYCLYQWASFGRGYLFERIVLKDLMDAGIALAAHLPERGGERYSASDLTVSGIGQGDIKTSLYFLDDLADARSDFYITRLYDAQARSLRQVVVMTPQSWQLVNGEPHPATIAEAARHFPQPVLVEAAGKSWVMVEYAVWKDRILRWQVRRSSK
jgi:hypothetical protein